MSTSRRQFQPQLFDDAPYARKLSDYDMRHWVEQADFWHASHSKALDHTEAHKWWPDEYDDSDAETSEEYNTTHAGTYAAASKRSRNANARNIHPLVVPEDMRQHFRLDQRRIHKDRGNNRSLNAKAAETGPVYYENIIEDRGALSVVAPRDFFSSYGHELEQKRMRGERLTLAQEMDLEHGNTSVEAWDERIDPNLYPLHPPKMDERRQQTIAELKERFR